MTDIERPMSERADTDLAAALEAILFVADRPLTAPTWPSWSRSLPLQVADGLAALAEVLEGRGLRLQQLDGSWQLSTAPAVADRVRRYARSAPKGA